MEILERKSENLCSKEELDNFGFVFIHNVCAKFEQKRKKKLVNKKLLQNARG